MSRRYLRRPLDKNARVKITPKGRAMLDMVDMRGRTRATDELTQRIERLTVRVNGHNPKGTLTRQ